MSHTYFAHVVPGLEQLAEAEMHRRLEDVQVLRVMRRFDERTSLILFRHAGPSKELLSLRLTEDIFVLAAASDAIPSDRRGLDAIRQLMAADGSVARAAAVAAGLRPRRGKITFRVIARSAGQHAFRRVDVQRAVELGVLDHFPAWRLVADDARLEVWAQLVGARLLVGIRLSDIAMRQRTYRPISLPAALKPTIASAMITLSHPQPDDVFLDPMCGSGTILLERAQMGRYQFLLAGDSDPEAVRVTRENVGPRYKPIMIERWDARTLPIETGTISVLVCNLPFGKQIGTPQENKSLYPALLREWSRVMRPGGRMVLLTSERDLMRHTLREHQAYSVEERGVLVRGLPSTIFAVRCAGPDS